MGKDCGSGIGRGQTPEDFVGQDEDLALHPQGYGALLKGLNMEVT